ncbi:hypothetical protein D3C81_811970 [compost metagenome]
MQDLFLYCLRVEFITGQIIRCLNSYFVLQRNTIKLLIKTIFLMCLRALNLHHPNEIIPGLEVGAFNMT